METTTVYWGYIEYIRAPMEMAPHYSHFLSDVMLKNGGLLVDAFIVGVQDPRVFFWVECA